MEKVELKIGGMHCGACATGIQMVAEQMDGVSSAFVDRDKEVGTFEFDGEKVKKEDIIAEITKLGYTAS